MAEVENNENVSEEGQLISESAILQLINLCKTEINNKTDEVNDIITKATFPTIFSARKIKRKHFVPIDNIYPDDYNIPYGERVFNINNKAYYLYDAGSYDAKIYCFNSKQKKWEEMDNTFSQNLYYLDGKKVWTDGTNIYYGWTHQINNIDEGNFSEITMTLPNGIDNIKGENIWSDGSHIYYDEGTNHLTFNKETKTWSTENWVSTYEFNGNDVWTDGYNIYSGFDHKLNILEHKWETVDRSNNGFSGWFNGFYIWTDGKDIYHTCNDVTFVLDILTQKWYRVPLFDELEEHGHWGQNIWTDFYNIYYTDFWDNEVHSYILKEDLVNLHYII